MEVMRLRKFTEEDKRSAKDDLWYYYGNERGLYADFFEYQLTKELIDYYFDIYYYCFEVYCRRYEEDMSFDTVEREMCADYIAVKMGLYEPDEIFSDQFVNEMVGIEKKIGKKIEKKVGISIKNFRMCHPFVVVKPTYFYRVSEYTTNKGQKFSNEVDFKTGNLLKDREAALEYFQQRFGFRSGKSKFHQLFQTIKNFIHRFCSGYSLVFSLVEYYHERSYFEYPLLGEDEATCVENRGFEDDIINQQFISVIPLTPKY